MNKEKANELATELLLFHQKLSILAKQTSMIYVAIFHFVADEKELLNNQSKYIGLNMYDNDHLDELIQSAYNDIKGNRLSITDRFFIVSGWALFEDLLDSIEVLWLETVSDDVPEKLKSIKLPLGDYYALSKSELLKKAISRYIDNMGTPKRGINKRLLAWNNLGMIFKLDKKTIHTIHEFNQFRNCIVHNQGKVSDYMLRECPWLKEKVKVGDIIEPDIADILNTLSDFPDAYKDYLKTESLYYIEKFK